MKSESRIVALPGRADLDSSAGDGEQATRQELMGSRLRAARLAAALGVRELGRQLGVSASLISQIELGRVAPSVSTLYTLTNVLGISMDGLFLEEPAAAADPSTHGTFDSTPRDGAAHARQTALERASIQRSGTRRSIELEQGVRWELLTPDPQPGAEFLEVRYPVGGGSSSSDHSIRHSGRDYCLILDGTLSVQIGFETHVLEPGDSCWFDATLPHHFWNAGEVAVRAIWFVLDRGSLHP